MSRYQDDGGDGDYNTYELWSHNVELALTGKRGKAALVDLKAALEALPEKRLIERALCTVGGVEKRPEITNLEQPEGVCAVGAYVWWQKVKQGKDPMQAFEELDTLPDEDGDIWDTVEAGTSAGLTRVLAWELAYMNDETYGGLTPEQRYEKFMAWVDEALRRPPAPPRQPRKPKRLSRIQQKLASWQQLAAPL